MHKSYSFRKISITLSYSIFSYISGEIVKCSALLVALRNFVQKHQFTLQFFHKRTTRVWVPLDKWILLRKSSDHFYCSTQHISAMKESFCHSKLKKFHSSLNIIEIRQTCRSLFSWISSWFSSFFRKRKTQKFLLRVFSNALSVV